MSLVFKYERLVEFADTDAAGIVHFTKLIQYMESAEHALLRSIGTSVMQAATRSSHSLTIEERPQALLSSPDTMVDLSWPRVKLEVEFLGTAYFEDRLEIEVCITKLGRSSIQYRHAIYCDDGLGERKQIAKGNFTVVCCTVVRGQPLKSIEIPASLRNELEKFVEV